MLLEPPVDVAGGGAVGPVGEILAAALERGLERPDALLQLAPLAPRCAAQRLARGLEPALGRLDVAGGALEQLDILGAAGLTRHRGQCLATAVCDLEQLGRLQLAELGVDLGLIDRQCLRALAVELALELLVEGLSSSPGSGGWSRSSSAPTLM
jgi:hypothetical protein